MNGEESEESERDEQRIEEGLEVFEVNIEKDRKEKEVSSDLKNEIRSQVKSYGVLIIVWIVVIVGLYLLLS